MGYPMPELTPKPSLGQAGLPAAVQENPSPWLRRLIERGTSIQWLVLLAAVTIGLLLALVSPLSRAVVENWSLRDADQRAQILFRSIRTNVEGGLANPNQSKLDELFSQISGSGSALAIGFCQASGQLQHNSTPRPVWMNCALVPRTARPNTTMLDDGDHRIHAASFPLAGGHLIIAQDMAFAEVRELDARRYITFSLLAVILCLSILSAIMIAILMRGWTRSFRDALAQQGYRRIGGRPAALQPVEGDLRALLDDIKSERRYDERIRIDWSPATLHKLITDELPGAELIIVSNREPYIHNSAADGSITLQTPASGLVAALEPVARACRGTWIAHGSGSADRLVVDKTDRVAVPPHDPSYSLRRVWLTDEEQDGYYYGFANEGIWPLCHVAFVRPTFRESDWRFYQRINQRFADTIVEEATSEDPIILVQDYHFALLPRMIRNRLPKATIVTFWHIPWPNAETFGICPFRDDLVDGLLGSTILGFHTQFHCNNFLEAADRFMESRIDRELQSVSLGGHETQIRAYPISIEWPPLALAEQPPVEECRRNVIARFNLPREAKIAVGIERFDYTKGILDRIRAIDDLLTREPHWRGRLVFIQAAAPTRSKLDSYNTLQQEAEALVDEVNRRHASKGYQPIHLVVRHHDQREVFELFRAADVCIVSSLHDGMNLVAKEFVAARDDEQGVLILSNFAGASRELAEALIINPYDTHRTADALAAALAMPPDEQQKRMHLMRAQVRSRNVYRWAAQMLQDAAITRRRFALSGSPTQ